MKVHTQPFIWRRFWASFIDYFFIFLFTVLCIYLFGIEQKGSFEISGWPSLLPVLFWLWSTVGVEQLFGRTLGNTLSGLKPISEYPPHQKPTFLQSFKRHLLSPIDLCFLGMVAIICIKSTPKHQRLGDLSAKTLVVRPKA